MGKHLDEIDARARLALADARRAAVLVPQVRRLPIADAIAQLQDRLSRDGLNECGDEIANLARALNGLAS